MALSAKAAGVSVAAVACTATLTTFVPSAPLTRMHANVKGNDQLRTDAHVGVETSGCIHLQNAGLLAGVVGAAAIFTQRKISRQCSQQTRVIRQAFENELGVQPPVGFWDPLGFTDDGDAFEFRRRRCVELKHGRVSMLACIGYIVPEYFRWPGYLSPSAGLKFADIPHGLAAITKVPAVGWTQVVFFGLAMELFAAYQSPDLPPGKLSSRLVVGLTEIKDWTNNYQFGPFGIINAPSIADPELRKKKLNAEIANGRLAMFAIMAMMFQNGTVGTTGPEMWLPPAASKADAVARRAFDKELGATLPFKYFDPLGLARDGDEGDFRRRRISEIKNGRVAMIACMGYIAPEYFRWPGYLSPSAGIKFADLPNGVAALSKMPAEGWAQIGVFIAFLELFPLRQEADRVPGDASGCGKLGLPYFLWGGASGTKCDPVGSERSLNAELNNGRLAMMAITGMVSQNVFLGTTGPEMWLPGS